MAFSSPAMRCSTPSPRWIHPPLGAMKLYFDGSGVGNSCVAGVGGLVRDSGGTTIFYFFGPAGYCSVNKAELFAILFGLREATVSIFKT